MFNRKNEKENKSMLEKGKSYTYEEIEKLFVEAQSKTITKINEDMKKSLIEKGKEDSSVGLTFMLHSLMVTRKLYSMLFEGDNE